MKGNPGKPLEESHDEFIGLCLGVSFLTFLVLIFSQMLDFDFPLSDYIYQGQLGGAFYSSCCFTMLISAVPGVIAYYTTFNFMEVQFVEEDKIYKANQKKMEKRRIEAKKRNLTRLKSRKPKLRNMAKSVFLPIHISNFEIDIYDEELTFSVNGRILRYEKSLTRTYKSIQAEMEEDKNRPSPEDDHYIPRCSICRIRPVQMRVSGTRYRHGDVCMSCDDDEC